MRGNLKLQLAAYLKEEEMVWTEVKRKVVGGW